MRYILVILSICLFLSCLPSEEEFIQAIEENDLEIINRYCENGGNVNLVYYDIPILKYCLLNGKDVIAEKLITNGADISVLMSSSSRMTEPYPILFWLFYYKKWVLLKSVLDADVDNIILKIGMATRYYQLR